MRVNIYAEELTDRVKIVEKKIGNVTFTGLRFYLELPVTKNGKEIKGPFIHRPGDDDSSAVTFWSTKDMSALFRKAVIACDNHGAVRSMRETKKKPGAPKPR